MYEKELATFRKRLTQLNSGEKIDENKPVATLPQVAFTSMPDAGEAFTVEKGANMFCGANAAISEFGAGLAGMKGIRISPAKAERCASTLPNRRRSWWVLSAIRRASTPCSIQNPEQWNLVLLNAINGVEGSRHGSVGQSRCQPEQTSSTSAKGNM